MSRPAQRECPRVTALGDGLSWERLDNRRASRLAIYQPVPSSPPLDENPALTSWAIATMSRWNDALRPNVADLEPSS